MKKAKRMHSEMPALTRVRLEIASETIPGIGGLAHYMSTLDKALRAYVPSGCVITSPPFVERSIVQVAEPQSQLQSLLKSIPIIRVAGRWVRHRLLRGQWGDSRAWAARWRQLPGDAVCLVPHAVMNDEGALDQYYAAISKCNFVWVIHDLHAYHYPDQWSPKDLHLMRRRFLQLAKSASAIIVHNDYTADDAAEKLSIERDRISVVRLPAIFAEKEKYVAKSTDADLLCSLGVTAPYALWASSSTYSHKNHECLLHAWRLLADRNCIIPLICTGSKGPRWEKVSRCISELNLEQHVQFTGPVSDEALAALVRNAKVAVCPTLFEGGGCGPASEAMIAGVPVAVSDIPQVMEQFGHRTDLCTFFDANIPESIATGVEDVLHNYESSMQRAHWAAQQFQTMRTWQAVAEGYWKAVESVRERSKKNEINR